MCTGNWRCLLKNNPSSLLLASSLAVGRESEPSKKVYYSLLQPYKMLTLRHVSWQGPILASQAAFASSAELQVGPTTASAVHRPACMCFLNINTVNIYSKEGNCDIRVSPDTLKKCHYPALEVIQHLAHSDSHGCNQPHIQESAPTWKPQDCETVILCWSW